MTDRELENLNLQVAGANVQYPSPFDSPIGFTNTLA